MPRAPRGGHRGRPPAPVTIVDPMEIMTVQAKKDESSWTLCRLAIALEDKDEALKWLARRGLIHNSAICPRDAAHGAMHLISRTGLIDEKIWKCSSCKKQMSIREGSFFSKGHLELKMLVRIMFGWSVQMEEKVIMAEAEVGSNNTIIDHYNFCRDIASRWLLTHDTHIGGAGEIVECDESAFGHKAKYGRGRGGDPQWIFGGIQRGSRKCFMHLVEHRDADTLLPLIQRNVLPITHILTDGWPAYNDIPLLPENYSHEVIIHKEHFVDPNDPTIHTQSIESLWSRAKDTFKRIHDTTSEMLPNYVDEIVWREWQKEEYGKNNMFMALINSVCEAYPL